MSKPHVFKQLEPEFWNLCNSLDLLQSQARRLAESSGGPDDVTSQAILIQVNTMQQQIARHLRDIDRWLSEVRTYGTRLG